jgi:hypothetical protein
MSTKNESSVQGADNVAYGELAGGGREQAVGAVGSLVRSVGEIDKIR